MNYQHGGIFKPLSDEPKIPLLDVELLLVLMMVYTV